jgi:hypothetical protein
MNRQKHLQQVIGAMLITLLLVGCGAPAATPTPISPTATPTPVPPTATPTPVPPTAIPPTQTPLTLVTNVEVLIGNWKPLSSSGDAMFLQINSDGTCRQSFSLDGLRSVPTVECTYIFENSVLSMTAVKLNGVPECPSPTGSYEVRLISDDQIQLGVNKDSCAPRKRSTAGLYQRIP